MKTFSSKRDAGFTLVELLAVMAILAMVTVMTVPLLGGRLGANELDDASREISLMLDQARACAMARNTYAWVGFNTDQSGRMLTVSVVAGTTGSASDIASAATYAPVSKAQTFSNVNLRSVAGLTGMEEATDISSSRIPAFQLPLRGGVTTFANVLQFSPSGEASLSNSSLEHWVQIGLGSARSRKSPNIAALQVAGLTGQVQVFRQ